MALRSLSIFNFTITHCKNKKTTFSDPAFFNRSITQQNYLWWMDANWSVCSIGLFTLDAFDVNYKFFSVYLHYFSNCVALVMTADNLKTETIFVQLIWWTEWTWSETLTCTSSSLRTGMLRTLYLDFNSFDNGAVINFLRMCDGALKCLLRFLLRSDVTCLLNFMLVCCKRKRIHVLKKRSLHIICHWQMKKNEVSFGNAKNSDDFFGILSEYLCYTVAVRFMHTLTNRFGT